MISALTFECVLPGLSNGQAQDSPKEAAWKRMAPSLQCGGDQMKFRAVGPGASQFTVDQGNWLDWSVVPYICHVHLMSCPRVRLYWDCPFILYPCPGNAHPMLLSQVPSTCGYTMQRNSLALVMLVPYDGCNMVQEVLSFPLVKCKMQTFPLAKSQNLLPMVIKGLAVTWCVFWCTKCCSLVIDTTKN